MASSYCHACVRKVPGNTSNWTQIQTKTAELCSKVTFIYFLDATDIKAGESQNKKQSRHANKTDKEQAKKMHRDWERRLTGNR